MTRRRLSAAVLVIFLCLISVAAWAFVAAPGTQCPIASVSQFGCVKIGTGFSFGDDGALNATGTGGGSGGGLSSLSFTTTNGFSASFSGTTTGIVVAAPSAGGAFASSVNNLGFFAATSSAQLAGVISDETGTGLLVFNASPILSGTVSGAAANWSGAVSSLSETTSGLTVNGTTTQNGTTNQNGAEDITSTSATALTVGTNGTTTPIFTVDDSTASAVAGVVLKGAATGGTVTLKATDSGSNTTLEIDGKGTGNVLLQGLGAGTAGIVVGSTGSVSLGSGATTATFVVNGTAPRIFTFNSSGNTFFSAAWPTSTAGTIWWNYLPIAVTGMTASTNAIITSVSGTGIVRQHNTGALTLQTDNVIAGTTDSFVGASALTNGASLEVLPKLCGTNGTCTNESAIYIPTLNITSTGATTNSYGLNVAAATGATNNYAANFAGDITFTGSAPAISACGSGSIVTGSTDHKGQVSGITAATACTITFSQALAAAPACSFNTNAAISPTISSISTTAVTTTMTALTGTLYYMCF